MEYYDEILGWRMFSQPGAESATQYFIIKLQTGKICGVTDSPNGFKWEIPHILVPTRGLHPDNMSINHNAENIWADPVDESQYTHSLPSVEQFITGQSHMGPGECNDGCSQLVQERIEEFLAQ